MLLHIKRPRFRFHSQRGSYRIDLFIEVFFIVKILGPG